jgi:hypothetical protein
LGNIRQCSIGIVGRFRKLSWSQGLGRIDAGSAEKLAIDGDVQLRIGTDRELGTHGRTSGSHVTSSKRDSSKRIENRAHGDVLVTRGMWLRVCGALAVGVMMCAEMRLVVHVRGGAVGLDVSCCLMVRHGNLWQ